MVALALALQLFAASPGAAHPDVHLVPPLTLAQPATDADLAPGEPEVMAEPEQPSVAAEPEVESPAADVVPDLAPPTPWRPAAPGGGAQVLSSSMGFLLGDVISAGVFTLGAVLLLDDLFGSGGGDGDEGAMLVLMGAGLYLALPPSIGVAWAIRAGMPATYRQRAYWTAFLVRIAGMALAASVGSEVSPAILLATDLVVAPLLVVRVLEERRSAYADGPSPAALAVPVRDAALAWRR